MNFEFIKVKNDERGVSYVSLSRPELHNAFNDKLIEELTNYFYSLEKNKDIKAVVLTGEGKSFCAGADLNWMSSMVNYSMKENIEDSTKLSNLFHAINDSSKLVIGLINGHALGGGVGLVSVCDYVLSHKDALFGFTEVRLGLIPAVISPFVIRKIGESNARATFLSGERFSSSEALKMNLVHALYDDETKDEMLEKIIKSHLLAAPGAMGEAKKLIKTVIENKVNLKEYTCEAIAKQRVSAEGQEGMKALLNKTKPSWVQK